MERIDQHPITNASNYYSSNCLVLGLRECPRCKVLGREGRIILKTAASISYLCNKRDKKVFPRERDSETISLTEKKKPREDNFERGPLAALINGPSYITGKCGARFDHESALRLAV